MFLSIARTRTSFAGCLALPCSGVLRRSGFTPKKKASNSSPNASFHERVSTRQGQGDLAEEDGARALDGRHVVAQGYVDRVQGHPIDTMEGHVCELARGQTGQKPNEGEGAAWVSGKRCERLDREQRLIGESCQVEVACLKQAKQIRRVRPARRTEKKASLSLSSKRAFAQPIEYQAGPPRRGPVPTLPPPPSGTETLCPSLSHCYALHARSWRTPHSVLFVDHLP